MKKLFSSILIISLLASYSCNNRIENEEENEKYENPLRRMAQEENQTIDPALGIVPKERLYAAIEHERANEPEFTLDGVVGVWEERGPVFDSVGTSNNNGRGGGTGFTGAYTSGRMMGLFIDKSDATGNTVFASGVNGGIWKCTNFMSTQDPNWTPVADYLDNIAVISICQNPVNSDIMYAATGEAHVGYVSSNGSGIYKSIDHGVTWNLLPSTTNYKKSFKIDCDALGNVYLASSTAGLVRSLNNGTTWTTISQTAVGVRCTDFEFGKNGKLHASFGYGTGTIFYRGANNPATVSSSSGWSSSSIPTVGQSYRFELACVNDTVYGVTASASGGAAVNYCFRSVNGGTNWTRMNTTAYDPCMSAASCAQSDGQAWFGIGLAVNPTNPENIIMGVVDGYSSQDGGANISKATAWIGAGAYTHADWHNVKWFNQNGVNTLIVESDGGIYLSEDDGSSFRDRNKNLGLKQFYSCAIHPTTTNYFLGGTQDNGSHRLTRPGTSYSTEVTGGDGGFCAIDQNQPQFQFTTYINNVFNRSTNGGNTWGRALSDQNTGSFINRWAYDDVQNIIIAGSGDGNFMRWTNPQSGSTTSIVTLTELGANNGGFGDAAVGAVTFSTNKVGRCFIGSSANGAIIKLENSRTTTGSGSADVTDITPGNPGSSTSSIAIGTTDSNLIVTYSNYGTTFGKVWYTNDLGATWNNVTGNLPDIPVRWAVFHTTDNSKAVIATELGVYTTNNLNATNVVWNRSFGLPYCRVDMLKLRKSDNTLLAATHGRGLWSTNILNLLPLKNITLSGNVKGESIANLNWKNFDASDNAKFYIEYSEDGINFKTISKATKATTSFAHNFSSERGYYRIIGAEPGSNPIYSNIISLKSNKAVKGLQIVVAPNPLTAEGRITISSTKAGEYNWQICNVQGCVIYIGRGSLNNNSENIKFDFGRLASGMYLLKVMQNGETKTTSFIKK